MKSLSDIPEKEIMPGYRGRFIHTESITEAYWTIAAGAPIETHQHPQEQIVNMQEGQFELTVDGEVMRLNAGDIVVIPSNVPHSGRAITNCRILDIWSPPRDDYR